MAVFRARCGRGAGRQAGWVGTGGTRVGVGLLTTRRVNTERSTSNVTRYVLIALALTAVALLTWKVVDVLVALAPFAGGAAIRAARDG